MESPSPHSTVQTVDAIEEFNFEIFLTGKGDVLHTVSIILAIHDGADTKRAQ